MDNTVFTKSYPAPEYNLREILRYAGVMGKEVPSNMEEIMEKCIEECESRQVFSYKVSYRMLPVSISQGEDIDFGLCRVVSRDLAKNLAGCENCIFFAATVGHGIDRMIVKYSRIDSAKALFMQAIGAERVESLCDTFCSDTDIFVAEDSQSPFGVSCGVSRYRLRPRFSPGYGDLSLEMQKDFLNITEAGKRLNISLGDSLLMSPSKSVTAIVGLEM